MKTETFITYQREIWPIPKDTIYGAIQAIEAGIEYAQMYLTEHDKSLGRTTLKNKSWAETMEKDIIEMNKTLVELRSLRTNN